MEKKSKIIIFALILAILIGLVFSLITVRLTGNLVNNNPYLNCNSNSDSSEVSSSSPISNKGISSNAMNSFLERWKVKLEEFRQSRQINSGFGNYKLGQNKLGNGLSNSQLGSGYSYGTNSDNPYLNHNSGSPSSSNTQTNTLSESNSNCTDSDGGQNAAIYGEVTKGSIKKVDKCASKDYIMEYYCTPQGQAFYKYLKCSSDCTDGACSVSN